MVARKLENYLENMKKTILILASTLILIGAGCASQSTAQLLHPIKIGAIISQTGAAATDGETIQRALELAKDDLAKENIAVEIEYQDDHTNPVDSVSAAQKILLDKPQAIIGPTWSFLVDAATPTLVQAKMTSYVPAVTSEILTVKNPYALYGTIKNAQKVAPLTDWIKTHNKKSVAILTSKDAWGDSHLAAYKEAAAQAGAHVVFAEQFAFGGETTGMATALTKIKAAGADVILWTGYDDGAAILLNKKNALKLNIPVVGTDGLKIAVSRGNATIAPTDEIYTFYTQTSSEFARKFSAKYGRAPGTYADSSYDGLILLARAIAKNSDNAANLTEKIRSGEAYKGYQTTYAFDSHGDISGGEWKLEQLK